MDAKELLAALAAIVAENETPTPTPRKGTRKGTTATAKGTRKGIGFVSCWNADKVTVRNGKFTHSNGKTYRVLSADEVTALIASGERVFATVA